MVEDGRIKMFRPISETEYRSSAKYAAATHEVPPTFRDFDKTVTGDPAELINTLQGSVGRVTEAVAGLRREGESLADTYTRVGDDIDREYNYSMKRQAREALPLMGPGVITEYSVGLYFAVESEVTASRAMFWKAEHPDTPNPFAEMQGLFQAGFLPRGFRVVNGEEQLVVDVPMRAPSEQPNTDARIILGCWSGGDERVQYFHMPTDDCEFNFDLNFKKGKTVEGLEGYAKFGKPEKEVDLATT